MPETKKQNTYIQKTYVLDTDVLMTSPYSLYAFDEHNVYIADITLEELDANKIKPGEAGANAREVIRILDGLRETGNLMDGVALPGGGTFRIEVNHLDAAIPESWDSSKPDNRILRVCAGLKCDGKTPILVSNDIAMRIKADLIRVKAEEYKTEQVFKPSEQYKGRSVIAVSENAINSFYKDGVLDLKEIMYRLMADGKDDFGNLVFKQEEFTCAETNEFFTIQNISNPKNSAAIGRFDGENVVPLRFDKMRPYGVKPRNVAQRFAQESLMTHIDTAPLVILKGPAGTAKTFYSLAAGLEHVLGKNESDMKRILVARPNILMDEEIGFLKGGEKDKIGPLIRPIYDNLEVLTKTGRGDEYKDGAPTSSYVQDLFDRGVIDMQALGYMRGRSISDTWVIIDEAQNMTPTQAFAIVSRAGIGSKIILAGDPDQIDNPRLDSRTNGLSYAAERMKGSPLCWQVTFDEEECVRSVLAKEAIMRMSPKGYWSSKNR